MATNTEYYRNLLRFYELQGTADEPTYADELDGFSDVYKSDNGVRPRNWSRRSICEYLIARPEYGYGEDGTPLHTLEDCQAEREAYAASLEYMEAEDLAYYQLREAEGIQFLVDLAEEEENIRLDFDFDAKFKRHKPSRAELIRAVS